MTDLNSRIAVLEGEEADLVSRLEDCRKKLDAYRLVAMDAGATVTSSKPKAAEKAAPKEGQKLARTTTLVRMAISAQKAKTFTVFDLDAWLKAERHEIPRNKVSFILASLIRRGEIRVVEKGAGRKPSTLETIKLK